MVRTTNPAARKSPRLAAKQERMREHIFRAAAGEFARRGYRATTMQDIAHAAGFSAPSLYTYFAGKQEILSALGAFTQLRFDALFSELSPTGLNFEQQFELLLHRMVAYVGENRDAAAFLFMAEPEVQGAASAGGWQRGWEVIYTRLTAWLEEHAHENDLGGKPPHMVANYLTGIILGAFIRFYTGQVEEVPRLAAEVREIFFRGVTGKLVP
jgi:AcrR family transcriptional regulator